MNSPAPARPHSPRNYPLLLAGQFLGAFGDNFLLAIILAPLTFQLLAGQITEQQVNGQNVLFSAVFFFPFILLAPLAGFFNDRLPKTTGLFWGNALKVLGTVIGGVVIWTQPSLGSVSHLWQVIGYTIVGIGACLYSPAKYGVLPEILPANRLVKANGAVEMLTLVAILGGLWGGATLYDHTRTLTLCYAVAAALYLLALGLNAAMQRTPHNPTASLHHSVGEFTRTLTSLARHPRVGRVLLGSGTFWFAGAVLRSNLQGWGLQTLRATGVEEISNQKLALLKIGLIVGVVLGSLLAGHLHKVGDLSWTRRYGLLLAGGILLLGLIGGHAGVIAAIACLLATGLSAGLMLIPLNAALQSESDGAKLGKTIAVQNFVDYVAMLVGAGFLQLLTAFNLLPAQVFVGLAATLFLLAFSLRLRRASPASTQ